MYYSKNNNNNNINNTHIKRASTASHYDTRYQQKPRPFLHRSHHYQHQHHKNRNKKLAFTGFVFRQALTCLGIAFFGYLVYLRATLYPFRNTTSSSSGGTTLHDNETQFSWIYREIFWHENNNDNNSISSSKQTIHIVDRGSSRDIHTVNNNLNMNINNNTSNIHPNNRQTTGNNDHKNSSKADNHEENHEVPPPMAPKPEEPTSKNESRASRSRKKLAKPLSSEYEICDTLLGNKIGERARYYYLCEPFTASKSTNTSSSNAAATAATAAAAAAAAFVNADDSGGRIECQWNPVLSTSFCEARNLLIDPSKIAVPRGGELPQDVMGRDESIEYPSYQPGAFQLSQCEILHNNDAKQWTVPLSTLQHDKNVPPLQHLLPFHLHTMMTQVRTTPNNLVCTSYEERPTLFVTRYEYCNAYHTLTDYYNAYQALLVSLMGRTPPGPENKQDDDASIQDITERDLRIIFMDGHAAGSLDEGWQVLFPNANISFVSALQQPNNKNVSSHHPACFRHAIFVSPGYRSPLSIAVLEDRRVTPTPASYISKCGATKWHANFRDAIVAHAKTYQSSPSSSLSSRQQKSNPLLSSATSLLDRNDFPSSPPQQNQSSSHDEGEAILPELNVVLVSRQDYFAHPRMEGKVTRKIKNEDELISAVYEQQKESKHNFTLKFKRVVLNEYNFAQQVLMMHNADIIIGMHGAGLSYVFLAQPGTVLVELKPPGYINQEHFRYLCEFAGAIHKPHILRTLSYESSDPTVPHEVLVDDVKEAFQTGINSYFYYQIKRIANEEMPRYSNGEK